MSASEGEDEEFAVAVGGELAGGRLDAVLAKALPAFSRNRIKDLILAGGAAINGQTALEPKTRVKDGDALVLTAPPPEDADPEPENIPLDIVYEDDDLLVLNKPKGLVVHPAAGHETGTLVNALIAHCGTSLSGIGGVKRPGIVHRLDKDTTGLMVVAKNDRAHQSLTAQFADHGRTGALRRGYMAFVWGAPSRSHGTIDQPIDRHPFAREKMAVRQGGRHAVTHWEMLESFEGRDGKPLAALLACQLETGRTHQIRVHLGHAGHPLIGDDVYGSGFRTKANQLSGPAKTVVAALGRQALHAYLLQIEHPATGEIMDWQSGLPEDLVLLQSALRAAP